MILFLLILTIVFMVVNTYFYLRPYQQVQLQAVAQKAVITPVIVEMFEDKNEWDDDPPTVVATPKNRSKLDV